MRQLTPIDAPTGSQRLPSNPPEAPLTARDRPRTHRGRKFLLAIAVVILLAAAATVVLARDGGSPTGGGDGSPDPELAAKLVAATIPDGAAFEPELVAEVGDAGARIRTAWSPAATSLTCDVAADPPVAAERHRLAVAAAEYTTSQESLQLTGRSERLSLTAAVLSRPGAERVLDEIAAAVPACAANPLSAMRDPRLGTLPNVDGVVLRANHSAGPGDGPDPAVSCVIVRQDAVVLRSCGLSDADARADGLAVRGLERLQVQLDLALRTPNLPRPPAEIRTPTWARTPTVTLRRDAYAPGCVLLTSEQVEAATGQRVAEFDREHCRWELTAGSVSVAPGDFGTSLAPVTRSLLRGNSAMFVEPAEGECVYRVATTSTAALRIGVVLTEPGTRPCAVARRLLGLAFDRLPPA